MTEREFNGFIHHLDELAKNKKADEQIAVDIYDRDGRIICPTPLDDDEFLGYRIIN